MLELLLLFGLIVLIIIGVAVYAYALGSQPPHRTEWERSVDELRKGRKK